MGRLDDGASAMTAILMRFRQLAKSARLARLLSHEGGIAAVEFSLILPILVVLWIGGVEVTGALSVDRRLNNLAASIGDEAMYTVKSRYFFVDVRARQGDTIAQAHALIDRGGASSRVVWQTVE